MVLVFPLTLPKIVGTDIFHAALLLWVAGFGHLVAGNVDLRTMAWLLTGSIPGVLLTSQLTLKVPDRALRLGLACVLALSGIKLVDCRRRRHRRAGLRAVGALGASRAPPPPRDGGLGEAARVRSRSGSPAEQARATPGTEVPASQAAPAERRCRLCRREPAAAGCRLRGRVGQRPRRDPLARTREGADDRARPPLVGPRLPLALRPGPAGARPTARPGPLHQVPARARAGARPA